jgi:hypothetical protein
MGEFRRAACGHSPGMTDDLDTLDRDSGDEDEAREDATDEPRDDQPWAKALPGEDDAA